MPQPKLDPTQITLGTANGIATLDAFTKLLSAQLPTAINSTSSETTAVTTSATFYPVFVSATTGNLPINVGTGLTFNPSTNVLTTTTFTGALSGNATTASTLATARTINGTSFDGSANIVLGGVPINNQTGTTYTFVLVDAGYVCTFTNASPVTVTVPPESSVNFPITTQIELIQDGAGKVTVAPGVGVTIQSQAGNLSLAAQYSNAVLIKKAADTWYLVGTLIA